MNFHNEKTRRGHNHQSLFEWCCRTICGMIFGNGKYHVTSILFGLPMDSGVCRGLCKKKLHGKSWEFYCYSLGCVEVSMKQNHKESPWTSHKIFWPVWIPCEEKVNGRICDFPRDPLGSVKNSLNRKSIENPGTFHGILWAVQRSPWTGSICEVLHGTSHGILWTVWRPVENQY